MSSKRHSLTKKTVNIEEDTEDTEDTDYYVNIPRSVSRLDTNTKNDKLKVRKKTDTNSKNRMSTMKIIADVKDSTTTLSKTIDDEHQIKSDIKDISMVVAKSGSTKTIVQKRSINNSKSSKKNTVSSDESDEDTIDIESLIIPKMVETVETESDEDSIDVFDIGKQVNSKNKPSKKNQTQPKKKKVLSKDKTTTIEKENYDSKDINLDKTTEIDAAEKKTKKTSKNSRVTMYVNDDDAKPVTAGGVLIYKKVNNKMMLLIIDCDGKYSDIGGKIDPIDTDIYDGISREVEEETNGMIKREEIVERLKTAPYTYVKGSKYVIYIVEASNKEKHLTKADFGDAETHDNLPRTIAWVSRDELVMPATIKFKLNWRMKSRSLMDKLAEIEKQFKLKNNMFKKISVKESKSTKKTTE